MATVVALRAPVLHLSVAQRLRTLIIEGALAPGEKLNERELAAQLQVSRTPLREALKLLTAEGLVEHLPNRGVVVSQLDSDDVMHAFELIGALEAIAGKLACERITPAELNEIRALHFEMLAQHARGDLSAYYRLNASIHRAINVAARNPILTATYDRVNARLQALRFRSNLNAEKWATAVAEHDAMVLALLARDGKALAAILTTHMRNKRDAVLAQLRTADAQARA